MSFPFPSSDCTPPTFALLGLGVSGAATLRFLRRYFPNSRILISDLQPWEKLPANLQELLRSQQEVLILELGQKHSERCLEADYRIVSPGISPRAPILQAAQRQQRPILSEVELASSYLTNWIGVTGTNGKSTVSAWIAHILGGLPYGNIGRPLVEALQQADLSETLSDWLVCELSSFQLTHSGSLHPSIALITNITPDHLDWHDGYQNYLQAKRKITAQQNASDWLILPASDPLQQTATEAQIFWVYDRELTAADAACSAAYVDTQGHLILRHRDQEILLCGSEELPLPGEHNRQNALFSAAATFLAGIPVGHIRECLLSFPGLAHRLEFVREVDGKRFYNDSKATNPASTVIALRAFAEPIVWLAGGRDKNTSLDELCQLAKDKVCTAILFGEARERFARELRAQDFPGEVLLVDDLQMALKRACLQESAKLILLSPACASFDQFRDFEERGECFKKLVWQL